MKSHRGNLLRGLLNRQTSLADHTRRRRPLVIAAFGFTFGVLFGPGAYPILDLIAGLFCVGVARRRTFKFQSSYALFLGSGFFLGGLAIPALLLPTEAPTPPEGVVEIRGVVVEVPDHGPYADGLVIDLDAPVNARALIRVPHHLGPYCMSPRRTVLMNARLFPRRTEHVPPFRSRRLSVQRGVQLHGEATTPCRALERGHSPLAFVPDRIARAIIDTLESERAPILAGLATGRRYDSPAEAKLSSAGLGYVLELQGLVLAFLVAIAFVRFRRGAPWVLGLGLLLFGATPTIARCAAIIGCLLLASRPKLELDSLDAISLSLIVVLALSPAALGDIRYQLAFAGCSAAVRLYPRMRPRWARLALIAVAVTIGTMPMVARLFDRVTLPSLLMGPVAVFVVVMFAAPMSIVGGLLAVVAPALGRPFLFLADQSLRAIIELAPQSGPSLVTPTMLEAVLLYLLLGALVAPKPRFKIAALIALIMVGSVVSDRWGQPEVDVSILPSSQVIRDGDQTTVVDFGSPTAWFQMEQRHTSNELKRRRLTRIDHLYCRVEETCRELSLQFQVAKTTTGTVPLSIGHLRFEGQRIITKNRTIITSSAATYRLTLDGGVENVVPLVSP